MANGIAIKTPPEIKVFSGFMPSSADTAAKICDYPSGWSMNDTQVLSVTILRAVDGQYYVNDYRILTLLRSDGVYIYCRSDGAVFASMPVNVVIGKFT